MNSDQSEFVPEYDVAISFTEAQRDLAVGIRLALDSVSVSCYYYMYDKEENAGKDLKANLRLIYSQKSLLNIAIITPEYLLKDFSKVEFEAILKRLAGEPDSLIPIRLSDEFFPEGMEDITFLLWDKDPKSIAEIVLERLRKKSDGWISSNAEKIAQKNPERIQEAVDRLIRFNGQSAHDYYTLGLHFFFLNRTPLDMDSAAEYFLKATALKPSHHQAHFYYSKAFIMKTGFGRISFSKMKEPVQHLEHALRIFPDESYKDWLQEIDKQFYARHGLRNPLKHFLI